VEGLPRIAWIGHVVPYLNEQLCQTEDICVQVEPDVSGPVAARRSGVGHAAFALTEYS